MIWLGLLTSPLHAHLKDMKAVATVPSLYPVLVELNVVPSILGLLNHDNTDISVGVVDLLQVCQNLRLRLENGTAFYEKLSAPGAH